MERQDFPHGTIYRDDAIEVARLAEDGSVDLVLTDPPYCSGGSSGRERTRDPATKYQHKTVRRVYPTFGGDHRDQRSFLAWCALWVRESTRLLPPGALHAQFTDWRQLPVTTDAVQAAGLVWGGIVAWDKTETARPRMGTWRQQAEFLVWATNGRHKPAAGVGCLPGAYRQAVNHHTKLHMCAKPVELAEALVQACPEGGLVADWFAGSGTVPVACIRTGRRFLAAEVSAEYFDIACRRIEAAEAEASQ